MARDSSGGGEGRETSSCSAARRVNSGARTPPTTIHQQPHCNNVEVRESARNGPGRRGPSARAGPLTRAGSGPVPGSARLGTGPHCPRRRCFLPPTPKQPAGQEGVKAALFNIPTHSESRVDATTHRRVQGANRGSKPAPGSTVTLRRWAGKFRGEKGGSATQADSVKSTSSGSKWKNRADHFEPTPDQGQPRSSRFQESVEGEGGGG